VIQQFDRLGQAGGIYGETDTMYIPWHIGRMDANPAVIDMLLRRIGSVFAGDILHTLASHRGCLELFCQSIRHALDTNHIHYAASQLRNSIELRLAPCPDHLSYLAAKYSREQARQIKYVVEVFYKLEPVFAILTALARRWITRQYGGDTPVDLPDMDIPMCLGKIDFLDESHSAGAQHSFYRALAKWPDYAVMVKDNIQSTSALQSMLSWRCVRRIPCLRISK
jgi:hypothetical protein